MLNRCSTRRSATISMQSSRSWRAALTSDTKSEDGTTALTWAAMRSNAAMAEQLLAAGADPNISNMYGVAPLQVAIENAATEVAQILLLKGANPNAARESGETPLMTAARMGNSEIVKLLLSRHADPNAREKRFGQNSLMWAAGSPDIIRMLIDAGADLQVTTNVWDVKATIPGSSFRTVGATGVPWVFQGDYVSKKGGQNALMFAVQKRNVDSARMLLDAGLDVNSASADKTTPLLLAVYKWESADGRSVAFTPDLAMASFLLDRGAAINVADTQGYTPLHGAVLAASNLVAGANRNARGGRAGGAGAAARGGAVGGRGVPAASASRADWMQVVSRLLDGGADPNAVVIYPTIGPTGARLNPPPGGSTPLHIATVASDVELVQLLMRARCKPECRAKGRAFVARVGRPGRQRRRREGACRRWSRSASAIQPLDDGRRSHRGISADPTQPDDHAHRSARRVAKIDRIPVFSRCSLDRDERGGGDTAGDGREPGSLPVRAGVRGHRRWRRHLAPQRLRNL